VSVVVAASEHIGEDWIVRLLCEDLDALCVLSHIFFFCEFRMFYDD